MLVTETEETGLRLECVERSYQVEVPVEGFPELCADESLDRALQALDCYDIEAHPHFGAAVNFKIRSEDDSPERQAQILRTIQEHIDALK